MDKPVRTNKLVPASQTIGAVPSEALHPLMHSLLTFGLVHRVEDADDGHHWQLTDAAEQRLDHLTAPLDRSAAVLAYLDHWCARCRQQRLTHLIDGRYLCPDCERLEREPAMQATARPERRWERPLRSHRAL
ncbi:MAG: hypothetical protein ACRD0Z_14615 [Acidimicrobiales bacterium]